MKDNMDILLEQAFPANIAPDTELNEKLLSAASLKKQKISLWMLSKVAAIVIAIACICPLGVYAANQLINKVFVTDHTISIGNPDYVDDEAIYNHTEEVIVDNVLQEEGDDIVNWLSKKVEVVNNYATNTYYEYADYATAIADSRLDNWFVSEYENLYPVIYTTTETENFSEESIDATFRYGEGQFFLYESVMSGNVAADCAISIRLENTNNKRTYISPSQIEFTLVDEITTDDGGTLTKTFVMISYNNCSGYIAFVDLTEDEIHQILDTFVVRE